MSLDLTGDLFENYRARRHDPQTSHSAAVKVKRFATNHYGVILLALKDHGPMTISEIASFTRLDHVAVARRMPELETLCAVKVLLEHGIEVTRAGPSGRKQRVWTAIA